MRRLFPAILVATALLAQVFAGAGNSTVSWVTAFAFATFIFVVNGPAWALAPILVNEMTLYGFLNPMFGVAQRFIIAGIALLIALPLISRTRFFSDIRMRRVLLPALAFIFIVTVMNFQYSDEAYVYQYLRYQLVQLLMLVIAACVLRHVHDIRQLAVLVIVVMTAVALITIWQHYGPATAIYGVRDGTAKGRAVGLANTPVALASQLIFVLAPALGVLIAIPFRWRRKHLMLIGCALLIAAALNFTYTRSAVFAMAPTFFVMALLFRGRRRAVMLGVVVVGVVLYFALANTGLIGYRYYETAQDDRSAASHEALQDVSLAVALDNAVTGVGHDTFTTVSLNYVDAVDSDIVSYGGANSIGQEQPHNDFLNVWLSWGIFALIPFIAIFIGTLRNFSAAAKHPDPFVRGLAIGCIGGVVTYSVNSLYHNSLDSSMSIWLYAGLSVALARLALTAGASTNLQPSTARIQNVT